MPVLKYMVIYELTKPLDHNLKWLFENFDTHGEELIGMRLKCGLLVYGNCNTQLKDIKAKIARYEPYFLADKRPSAPGQKYCDSTGYEMEVQEFVTRYWTETPLTDPNCLVISTIGTWMPLNKAILIEGKPGKERMHFDK